VIKELYRRKDFYVLFVLTALITLLLGSVNFFNDDRIARYLKEICLLLIWISALVIAITTTARQIPASARTHHLPLLPNRHAPRGDHRKVSRLLAGRRPGSGGVYLFLVSSAARASTHGGFEVFPGALAAMDDVGGRDRLVVFGSIVSPRRRKMSPSAFSPCWGFFCSAAI